MGGRIQWVIRLHVEALRRSSTVASQIYKDAEAVQGNLSRTGAALVYSGANSAFTYSIGASDLDKYHQFWVEVVAV